MPLKDRRALVQSSPMLSLTKRALLLGVNRSTAYYKPTPKDDVDLMNEIQEIYEQHSFFGYRRITAWLNREGTKINHKKVKRLMDIMGLQAVYPKRKLSIRHKEHKVYPYLLKKKEPQKANDSWCTDISYIRIAGHYAYLTALIDCISRRIMGWWISPFLDATGCLKALEMALQDAKPLMINSDQGSQFTGEEWITCLTDHGIEISMDGKGRCLDNIWIERFWRSLKYEEVYLKDYRDVAEARKAISSYIDFYNHLRPHSALGYATPDEVYQASLTDKAASPQEGVPPPGGNAPHQRNLAKQTKDADLLNSARKIV
jgi:putative transposase